ncbi:MAG TPA: methyl-accepting chemotaxis protein [Burkholderiaceae bacterium]|nr:methyl-accepting chemotaxis protein [Burkholderiaceae bacterium]
MALDFGVFRSKTKRGERSPERRARPRFADVPPTQKIDSPFAVDLPAGEGGPSKSATATISEFASPEKNQKLVQSIAAVGLLFFLIAALFVWLSARNSASEERQIALIGDVLMHTQRLARAAPGAVQGEPDEMDQMLESRDQVNAALRLLQDGDSNDYMAPTSAALAPFLHSLRDRWQTTYDAANAIAAARKSLIDFGEIARKVNENGARMAELTEAVAADKLRRSGSTREVATAEQLVSLNQRIAKNANLVVSSQAAHAEDAGTLERDIQALPELAQSLIAASEGETRAKLQELVHYYREIQTLVAGASMSPQSLVEARNAQITIVAEGEPLRFQAIDLGKRYAAQQHSHWLYYALMSGFALLALGAAVAVVRVLLVDSRRRAAEAETGRAEAQRLEEQAKRRNDQNQAAILRLMNELQEVADGNLTVAATVTEDITGAIADSINYTVEELRALVGRINQTAELVSTASSQARDTATRLLGASDAQSREIRDTGERVVNMANQIGDVSAGAGESAKVARASLEAAERGQRAVYNQISSMNEIREQIQETSKRIKRLGESSQEIGEIVELITDITEQTNVLALNAAIQAASAGDAGRGFAVVAEEVQRLADRSGEAAKQIGALVRAIQTDTQDAVMAMEKSTQGVVEGTRLSDAAGTALAEIGRVSRQLTELIERIAQATSAQAHSAGDVSKSIGHILAVTEQTSEGTRQTALSIGQLAALARELKASVARFRVA